MKKISLYLTVIFTILTLSLVAQALTEQVFKDTFDYTISLITAALTWIIKTNLVKNVDDNWAAKLIKNTYLIAGAVFTAVVLVFIKFGWTTDNALLAVKFIVANLIGVFIGLVQKPKIITPPVLLPEPLPIVVVIPDLEKTEE